MNQSTTVETDLFEPREVKPHFINPCCFGEDFAAWLSSNSHPFIDSGFDFSTPLQEDYGWGLGAHHGKDPFWVAVWGDGPQEPPAHWVISVHYEPGLNLVKRLFHKSDVGTPRQLFDSISDAVRFKGAIRIVPQPPYDE